MSHSRTLVVLLASVALTGCQTYERRPLDLADYAEQWRAADVSSAAELGPRVVSDDSAFDVSDGLSLPEARAVGLTLNPDLRVQRLRAAVPLAGSKHAGLLDDPELGFDVLKIVENVDKPWIAGVGIGFTIPLSGRLAVDKDLAWADYSAAWRAVAVEEAELVAKIDRAWARWIAATRHAALLRAHVERLAPLRSTVEKLREAGELRPIDSRRVTMAMALFEVDLAAAESEAASVRREVLTMLGLVPDAPIELDASNIAVAAIEPSEADDAILAHPRLELAKARYEVAEQTLRREITKQYPDLTIGPAYSNEDGQSRIGLSGAIPIPLFNRNQRGIAEAAAARDATRAEAEREYQRLAGELADARAVLAAATNKRDRLSAASAVVDAQIEDVRKLIEIGEIDVLALTDAMERTVDVRSGTIEAEAQLADANARLRSLMNPLWVTVPATRDDEVQP